MGRALKESRDGIFIATKVSRGQWSPEQIRSSVEKSLRRLQVDVIGVRDPRLIDPSVLTCTQLL